MLLTKEADPEVLNCKITHLLEKKAQGHEQSLFIRPYGDKYLYGEYENGLQTGGRILYVKLFSIIALFILLIACINFTNLSTAKAYFRTKEIGIKKAIGANRKSLIIQFLSESILIALFSFIIAILLVWLLLPQFNQITSKELDIKWDTSLVLTFLTICFSTGLLSGAYPAFYLSSFKPVIILKGKTTTSTRELWTRKVLVVFQFTISVILIVAVVVFYKQIEFIQSKNLGYDKDNIILIEKEGNLTKDVKVFLQEVKNIPGVINASSLWGNMTRVPNTTSALAWEGKNPNVEVDFGEVQIDYDLIETLGLELTEGRAFSKAFGQEDHKIIFNEKAIEVMGLKDPVGKTVKLWGEERQIIGVVKNFHSESLYEPLKPLFLNLTIYTNNIAIKIKAGTQKETIARLNKLYGQYNPGITFEFEYLDNEHFNGLYTSEQRVATLSRYFAGMAILISCLGLVGLAAFTSARRRKEIGIRKVLGSTDMNIVKLLSGEFMGMVFTAIIIALPISYLMAKYWLDEYAYAIELKWWFFIAAGLIALIIAGLTLVTQTLKAARMNPVATLREE